MAGEIDIFCKEPGEKRPQEKALAQAVNSTFEKMGFMEARPTDGEATQGHAITAVIDILTPSPARIFFSAPQQLGWNIAETFYGLEEMTMEAVGDMMKELLNTITGSLLSTIMPNQQFQLSIPRLCPELPAPQASSYVYQFNIDNKGIITIVLTDNPS